jgi:hypothetical protein
VFPRGWFIDEHQAGHPGLDHEGPAIGESDHYPFRPAVYGRDLLADGEFPHPGNSWLNQNRPAPARPRPNILDASIDQMRPNTTNHRFHFGKLGHRKAVEEKSEYPVNSLQPLGGMRSSHE